MRYLCPWVYKVIFRKNKFPNYRIQAKCTCSSCTLVGGKVMRKNFYACFPLVRTVPVLVKGPCEERTGFYNWTIHSEDVVIACVCSIKFKIQN